MKIYSFASALPASLVALFAGSVASVALASPATDALATNLLETHNEIARTGNHVQNAVKALGELTSGDTTDLKAGFASYSESIRETESYA